MRYVFGVVIAAFVLGISIMLNPMDAGAVSFKKIFNPSLENVPAGDNGQDVSSESGNYSYFGTWLRQAIYVAGELQSTTPSTLVLKKRSFNSSSTCSASGSLTVKGNTMTMVMTASDCPRVSLPYTISYTYTISDKGRKMVIVTGPMEEIYKRK